MSLTQETTISRFPVLEQTSGTAKTYAAMNCATVIRAHHQELRKKQQHTCQPKVELDDWIAVDNVMSQIMRSIEQAGLAAVRIK